MAGQHLVFVAGASPQIITETVSALLSRGVAIGGIDVLTTETGRQAIVDALWGKGDHWKRLAAAYPAAKRCRFSPRRIAVLRDAHGAPLRDVRSPADSEAAGDQIADFVRSHTRAGDPPLHASIAGGRKTMGYLLGAAMMLYGRAEDRLSHVLVHPPELEGTDFFFRPHGRRDAFHCYRGPGKQPVRVKTSEIDIELAELPFPRLRAIGDIRKRATENFSSLVAQLQGEIDVLTAARVSVQAEEHLVICGNRGVRLSPVRTAIYALLAERRRNGCRQSGCVGCPVCFVSKDDIDGPFRERLSGWMRKQRSAGVSAAQWSIKNFLPEVPKINAELRRCLKGGSTPYEIKRWGPKGKRHHGLTLQPDAIAVSWE